VIEVGTHLLRAGELGARRVEVQIENRVEAVAAQALDEIDDRGLVRGSRPGRVDAVDPWPAVLVERDAHGVGVPGADQRDRGVVDRPAEDAGRRIELRHGSRRSPPRE
jgi:hypothetical protein